MEKETAKGLSRKTRVVIVLISIPVLAFAAYLYPAVQRARESAYRTVCGGMLGKLELALRNYHEIHGSFPPAYVADADGKPMHSWRVLILPYLDKKEIFDRYRFDEPWNSAHNQELARSEACTHFRCPSRTRNPLAPTTDYVLVVGQGTAFPGTATTSLSDFEDGPENTILVAEINNSDIQWMEPRDLDSATMSFLVNDRDRPSISAPHPAGPAVVFADRITSSRLPASLRPADLKALTTIAGHEAIVKDEVIHPSPQKAAR